MGVMTLTAKVNITNHLADWFSKSSKFNNVTTKACRYCSFIKAHAQNQVKLVILPNAINFSLKKRENLSTDI